MKKRLLSAVLALAMALTLLPMSVFATPTGTPADKDTPEIGKTSIQYINYKDNTKLGENNQGVGPGWIWQYKAGDGKTYWTCQQSDDIGGIVVGANASGVWYEDLDAYTNTGTATAGTLKGTTFTLLEGATITNDYLASTSVSGSLTVNLFGNDLDLGGATVLNRYNTVTITDTLATQYGGTAGTVSNIVRDVDTYNSVGDKTTLSAQGLTLKITGASVTGPITLNGRGNNVTLTGATVTGNIAMDGTTTVNTQKADGTVTSTATTYPAQTLTINSQAAQPNYGMPVIPPVVTGTIDVTGDNSRVALTDVKGTGGATGDVTVKSTGGTVAVDGSANLGNLIVGCGTLATKTQAPAAVTISNTSGKGGKVTSFTRTDNTNKDGGANNSTTAGKLTVYLNGEVTNGITTAIGDVTIDSGTAKGAIEVNQGSVTIKGSGAEVGNLTDLGEEGKTTLTVNGSGHKVGSISVATGAGTNLVIGSNWPTDRTNTFGTLSLGAYQGGGIKGGIFGTDASANGTGGEPTADKIAKWFGGLQFIRKTNDGKFAYYGPKELSAAIADAGAAAATTGVAGNTVTATSLLLTVMGSVPDKYVGFYNSTIDATAGPENAIALLGYNKTTGIYLPDKINGTAVVSWTNLEEAKAYPINEEVPILSTVDPGSIKLVIQSTGALVSKLTNAEAASGSNPNVTVTLKGNQVVLSGAVGQDAYEDIVVKFTTDYIGSNGNPVTFEVPVAYNTDTKKAAFGGPGVTPPNGVVVNSDNVVVGGNTYTLNYSGLAKPAPSLYVADMPGGGVTDGTGKKIVATVSVNMTPDAKNQLISAISDGAAEFDWTVSPAMRQSVNAAWATITNETTVQNWITQAQRAAWNLKNKGTPTPDELSATGFSQVVLVPYLQMNVTKYNQSGELTATLTPYYRVEVRTTQTTNTDPYYQIFKDRTQGTPDGAGNYLAQAGKPLPALNSNLTGTWTEVPGVGGAAATATNLQPGVKIKFNNLGSNFTNAKMHQDGAYVYEVGTDADTGVYTLTHAGKTGLGTIELNSKPHSVELLRETGAINQNGQKVLADTTSRYDSLQAAVDDTLPQLMDKVDTITVKSNYTGNGNISVSGEARTFDVKTEGNTTIASNASADVVKVTGTGHEFTVQLLKNNVTSASIVVSSDPNGNGTAAITSNNVNAKPGEKVTVTLTPKQGYQGTITAKTNSGAAVAVTNNGNNTFTFTVPSGATRVDVTPVFTPISALPFTDVATTANYYNAVKYCYEKNLIQGTTNTTFAPNSTITRAQIVTILWRQAGAPRQTPAGIYKDMPGNSDYYNAVIWATNNKIAEGYEDGRFYPDRAINRQELATFLYRYQVNFKKGTTAGSVGNLNSYTDASQVGTWANAAMRWAVGNGIVTSVSSGRLTPKDNAPRWQAATAMYMYCSGVLGIV